MTAEERRERTREHMRMLRSDPAYRERERIRDAARREAAGLRALADDQLHMLIRGAEEHLFALFKERERRMKQ